MSSYGLLDQGFVEKPVEQIIEDLEAEQRATIDPALDTSATSPIGQLNGIVGAALRELWELAGAVHAAFDPDGSSGASLAGLSSLTGTLKQDATKSTVTATLNIDPGRTVPAGSIASVATNPTARFVTLEAVTNSGGFADDFPVSMEAETAGVVIANAGTLTVIETPASGWNSITNDSDAEIGTEVEEDGDLRERREDELRASGAAAVEAIRADLLRLTDVTSCQVYENTSLITNVDGMPGKSIECVVVGGSDQSILEQIFVSKAAGIEPHGTTSGTVTDSMGVVHTIKFTRPTEIDVYLDILVEVNHDELSGPVFPGTGLEDIKTALSVFGQANLDVGDDLYFRLLYDVIFSISGVIDVTQLFVDTSPGPSVEQNVTIGTRQVALLDTANMTVAEA